jgi:hypothetical protein
MAEMRILQEQKSAQGFDNPVSRQAAKVKN